MALTIAWYAMLYRRPNNTGHRRHCAIQDFAAQIQADGGAYQFAEVLGGNAVVCVYAEPATLTAVGAAPGTFRFPIDIDALLSTATNPQRNAIRNRLLAAGYSDAEITAAFPDLSLATLRQVLTFYGSRKNRARYDAASDTIVLDGPTVAPALFFRREVG